MRLLKLHIKNFRLIQDCEFTFAPSSFLIGRNNYGKSSVVKSIEYVLTGTAIENEDFHIDPEGVQSEECQITAFFTGITNEVAISRGFKGRVVDGEFVYRKTYKKTSSKNSTVATECLQYSFKLKDKFKDAKKGQCLVDLGLNEELVKEKHHRDLSKDLKKGWEKSFLDDDVVDFDNEHEPIWFVNPGGIPGNIISRLPEVVHIPPLTNESDLEEGSKSNTQIGKVLDTIFKSILEKEPVAKEIQLSLDVLEKKMDSTDPNSQLYKLREELNNVISGVFPSCGMNIEPSLKELSDILTPNYKITFFSNVETSASRQGTGVLRTAIFSLLRYRYKLNIEQGVEAKPLLVIFEEPELYLHPSAGNLLRDLIYQLGEKDQIICTTHSPLMIDLSKDLQSLTLLDKGDSGDINATNYGVSEIFNSLGKPDRVRVKLIQLFDDELSRCFFASRIVIVEGDSELVAFECTLSLLESDLKNTVSSRVQVVRARGKAYIISLVKYLQNLSLSPFVIHDEDEEPGATKFNEPIKLAVNDDTRLELLVPELESVLGYKATSDKPFKVFQKFQEWKNFQDLPERWREVFCKACEIEDPSVSKN